MIKNFTLMMVIFTKDSLKIKFYRKVRFICLLTLNLTSP